MAEDAIRAAQATMPAARQTGRRAGKVAEAAAAKEAEAMESANGLDVMRTRVVKKKEERKS
jgi:hypothetical protein